jgi:hypothetical protein
MNQFAKKLPEVDPEIIARAVAALLHGEKGSPLRKLVRLMARLAKRLRTIEATVNHTDAKQDVEHAKLERATRKILRAVYGSAGFLGFSIVAMAFVQCQHVQPSPPASASPSVTVNLGTGVAEQAAKGGQWDPYGFLVHAFAGGMGERKAGRPMPHHPLPHQAVAPCTGSATTLYSACWVGVLGKAPPCPPDLYQEGNACYIPIAADPNVPVQPSSEQPRPGQGEPTGEQPRPMQEMPGKEQ